jgi:hypothetical protein
MSDSPRPSPEPTLVTDEQQEKMEQNTPTATTTEVHRSSVHEDRHLQGMRLITVHTGLLLCVFLVALDQSIVATAIPRIASQFKALEQVTWIVSAYFREPQDYRVNDYLTPLSHPSWATALLRTCAEDCPHKNGLSVRHHLNDKTPLTSPPYLEYVFQSSRSDPCYVQSLLV